MKTIRSKGSLGTVSVIYRSPARTPAEQRQRAGFRRWFETFDCAAEAWRAEAEQETALYATELAEYRATCPPPALKSYMLATAGQPRP